MPPRILGGTAGRTLQIRLVDGAEAAGAAAPETAEEGFDLSTITREFRFEDRGMIMIHAAGEATVQSIVSATVWGYFGEGEADAGPADWGPVGAEGGSIPRGALNDGLAITQVGARKIMLLESVGGMRALERIAVATGAISADTGDPLVHVDLILTRAAK